MSTELAPPQPAPSPPEPAPIPLSPPELWALGDRVGEAMERAAESTIAALRALYVEPLLGLLDDCPRLLAAPEEPMQIPVPPPERQAERQQYVCAIEGAKQALADRVVELVGSAPLRATEQTTDALADSLRQELERIADALPEEGEADQEERHFVSEPIESRRLRGLKALKRALRPLRRRWTRRIPARAVARLASAGMLDDVAPVLADLRRLRARVLVAGAQELSAALELTDRRCESALAGGTYPGEGSHGQAASAVIAARRERRIAFRADVAAAEAALRAAAVRAGERFAIALGQVGTVECPASTVEETRVARRLAATAGRRRARTAQWIAYERALANGLLADGEIIALSAGMHDAIGNMIGDVQETGEQQVRAPLAQLERRLRDAHDRAEAVFAGGGVDAGALGDLREEVARAFAAGLGPLRGEADPGGAVRAHVQRGIDLIAALPRVVPERCALAPVPEDQLPAEPPAAALRDAPLRALAEVHCAEHLARELNAVVVTIHPEYAAVRAEIERMEQAIEFNLTSAIEAMVAGGEPAQESARDLVCGVLHRSTLRLGERVQGSHALEAAVADGVRSRAAATVGELFRLVRSRDAGAMLGAIRRSEATARLSAGVEAGRRASSVALVRARTWVTGARAGLGQARRRLGRRLGVGAGDRAEVRVTLEDAVLGERTLSELPLAYRRLFTTDPLEWTGFTVGREAELAVIRSAYQRWRDGGASSVALFGEKGSGKTTVVHAARQQIFDAERVRSLVLEHTVRDETTLRRHCASLFGGDEPLPLPELARRLRAGERTIAIVENTQNLFLRRISGFDVLQDFLAFVRATRESVLWIITMEEYAWRYLERTIAIQDSFVHELYTTNLSADKIQEAILLRHHMSGYGLRFQPDPRLQRSRRYRGLRSSRAREEAAQRFFFDALGRIAEGNVFVALFYWLRSIAAVEQQALVFRTPRVIEATFLDALPLATLHTVAAVIQHGGLDAGEHSAVFQIQPRESERMLWALADARLLVADGEGQYGINPVLYRPFVRLLRDKNIFA